MSIVKRHLVDDSGLGNDGTILNDAERQQLLLEIDTAIATTAGPSATIPLFTVIGPTVLRTYAFPDANAGMVVGPAGFAQTIAGPTAARTFTVPDANAGIVVGPAGFAQTITGPTAARTYALPDANATILTDHAAVTVAQGGTGLATLTAHALYVGNVASAPTALAVGATGTVLIGNTGADPSFSASPTLTSVVTPLVGTATDVLAAIQVNGGIRWYVGASAAAYTWFPNADNANDIGNATSRVRRGYFGTALVVGGSPATSGAIRLAYGGNVNALNNAGSSDVGLIQLATIVGEVDTIAIGGSGNNVTPGSANAQDCGRPSAPWRAVYAGTAFVVGTNPATAGAIRMPTGATGIVFRNNANNADLAAMGSNASDVLTIAGNYVTTQIGSGGTFIGIGGLTSSFPALQRNAAGLNIRLADDSGYAAVIAASFATAAGAFVNAAGTITAVNAYQGPGTPASTGDWRAKTGFGFAYRNSVNSADLQILASDSSDRALFGDPGNGVMGVLYGSRIGFGGTTSSFPALKRDTIFLQHRLGDDSGVTGASTASLPVAASARDGIIGFDTTLNALVYYVGGNRFKVVGVSF